MRIEGPGGTSGIKKSEKTRKSGGAGGVFGSMLEDDGPAETTQARGSAPMGGIGSLLAVQGAEDPTEGKKRKKMIARADKVLSALDQIHRGLVTGELSVAHMTDVTQAMKESREKIDDPKLLGILDEVDLRAHVELAKLELAREKAQK